MGKKPAKGSNCNNVSLRGRATRAYTNDPTYTTDPESSTVQSDCSLGPRDEVLAPVVQKKKKQRYYHTEWTKEFFWLKNYHGKMVCTACLAAKKSNTFTQDKYIMPHLTRPALNADKPSAPLDQ